MTSIRNTLVLALWLSGAGPAIADDNWPQWRGPTLNGVSDAKGLPTEWGDDKNIVWRAPMPSWAGSSPVIWGDDIFLTSPSEKVAAEEPAEQPRGRRRRRGMTQKVSGPGGADLLLMCFSKKDGSLKWKRKLGSGNRFRTKHNMASPSPVTDGRHVVTLTGTGRLTCHDVDGSEKWSHDLAKEYGGFGQLHSYGSSPFLYRDRVIVEALHGVRTDKASYVAAYDIKSGKKLWRVERKTDAARECPDAYTTPTLLRHEGQDLIVISGADYVTAHDPKTGKEVWRCGGLNPEGRGNYRICGTPVAIDGMVIATSRISPVLAIRAGGKGDVTDSHVAWIHEDRRGPDVPSAACDGDNIYLVNDRGFVTCLDRKSGSVVWGPERIEMGPYSASPLVADAKVYITNEDGVTTVLAAGTEFKTLATNRLDAGYTLSSFAVSGDRMYLRTAKSLFCIGQPRR